MCADMHVGMRADMCVDMHADEHQAGATAPWESSRRDGSNGYRLVYTSLCAGVITHEDLEKSIFDGSAVPSEAAKAMWHSVQAVDRQQPTDQQPGQHTMNSQATAAASHRSVTSLSLVSLQ